ncbi:MAG: potassium transporter TrkA [Microbacteriaceae bacterium]|nr:potassium transporter TrkA [Microbacteriaceae bacterium]
MKNAGFRERFRYWFDSVMARGTGAVVGLLGVVVVIFILIIAVIIEIFGIEPKTERPFGEALWQNLLRALDSGTFAGDTGWPFRVAMLIVTVFGIFVVASLIGIISAGFDSQVENLRKGRSRVLETDHTLILGWSSKVFPIISEISIANESRRRPSIVVLAPGDKVEMEEAIHAAVPDLGKTRVIVRAGDPMNLTDLALSNPHFARSVVILAPEDNDDPDSVVIKTALALTNNPHRKADKYHIVGEIQDPENLEAANLVGKDEAHWVLASDLISRITVQSCRQSGLSVVYTELLDFDGDEIYFSAQPSLFGKTYFESQLAFADSTVMGIVKGETVHINPTADTTYDDGDQLILIAEDDSTIVLSTPGAPQLDQISTSKAVKAKPERTLVLGYNSALQVMLPELNEYVAPGSAVTVVAEDVAPTFPTFSNMTVEFQGGDTNSRATLESLKVETYQHIIVLAYKETMDVQRADAKTLVTLLHLRDMADRASINLNVVSEMLDDSNRELAEVTKADDFIVSDKLISLLLSQVSENKQLTDVFDTLFSSEGSEIYLRPAELYVKPGSSVDFYTVLEAARRRGETAIGFRIAAIARDSEQQYGVTVNPRKSDLLSFVPGDKVIVLAED